MYSKISSLILFLNFNKLATTKFSQFQKSYKIRLSITKSPVFVLLNYMVIKGAKKIFGITLHCYVEETPNSACIYTLS